jgi:hypothetical protein
MESDPDAEEAEDYRMRHQPPTRQESLEEEGVSASLDKIDEVFPKDILDPSRQKNYRSGFPDADKEAFDVINSIKGDPDAEVTIYRGVPENVDDIQPNNWVTLSRKYAQAHVDSNVPGGKVIAKKVKASDLFTNADSIQEWGWDPASPNLDEKSAMFRDFDLDEDDSSKQVRVLSEESDSDFDDVEVDTSYLRKAAASSPTTDAVDEALAPFVDKYGMALIPGDIMSLSQLADSVNSAAADLRATPSAETNKKYKESLQAFLNHRAAMIQRAHEEFIIPGDMKQDWELAADSLLSVSELKLINAAIKPAKSLAPGVPGLAARKFSPMVNRKNAPNWEASLQLAREMDQVNKDNPIKDLAPNWEVQSFEKKLVAGESSLLDENGLPKAGMRPGVSPHIVRLLSRASALQEVRDFMTLGTIQLKDSSGVYAGNLTINSQTSAGNGKRYATDEEINALADSVMNAGEKLHLPGTPGSVAAGDILKDNGMDIFITSSGRELTSVTSIHGNERSALAYATPLFGITVFTDRVRNSQSDTDRGRGQLEGTPMDWWSSKINPNTMDTWDHTMKHEIGHIVDARGSTLSNSSGFGSIGSPSQYGRKNSKEKFAELFAKYMRGEPVSDAFMAILKDKGLLKSQQNN